MQSGSLAISPAKLPGPETKSIEYCWHDRTRYYEPGSFRRFCVGPKTSPTITPTVLFFATPTTTKIRTAYLQQLRAYHMAGLIIIPSENSEPRILKEI